MFAKRAAVAVAGLGLALSLTACSSNDDTTENNASYCAASATLQTEIAELKTLITSNATVDQINDQRKVVAEALADADEAAEDVADSVRAEIIAADKAFDEALEDIPNDATLAEAKAPYQAAIDAWNASMASIRSELGC